MNSQNRNQEKGAKHNENTDNNTANMRSDIKKENRITEVNIKNLGGK